MRYVQTIGRGLRTAPGKDKLIVLDHAGNALRLGLATDIHREHLDDGAKRQGKDDRAERSEPLPRLCDECKAVMSRMSRVCTQCGAMREAKSGVVHLDGELVEFGSGQSGKREPTIAEQADFFGELRWTATIRGYADGWCGHKFKERFGVWPNDPRIRTASPREPSLKTKNWLRSRAIAFAKERANG